MTLYFVIALACKLPLNFSYPLSGCQRPLIQIPYFNIVIPFIRPVPRATTTTTTTYYDFYKLCELDAILRR